MGDKRWAAAQPAPGWTGTLEATHYGAICSQTSVGGTPASTEDCLFLNVFTPEPAPTTPLPVMVWLHGGAYIFGSGGAPYQGDKLVTSGNVIIVTFNYRLGAIGFLAHPALTAEAKQRGTAPSNFGLLDQRLALQWVRDNIAAFGGDKNNVTIFGESAGANGVCQHLLSSGSWGLFQRAIVESGLCLKATFTLAEAEARGVAYAAALGCTDPSQALSCLRALDSVAVTAGPPSAMVQPGGIFFQDTSSLFSPIIDGVFVTEPPEAAFAAGRVARVPVLHGANTNEGILFHASVFGDIKPANPEEHEAVLRRRLGDRAPEVAARYPNMNLAAVSGDALFRCPAIRMASYLTAAGIPNYFYRFNLTLDTPFPGLAGQAFHSAEIPYVFGNSYVLGSVPVAHAAMSPLIMGYWTRFAKAGDPNGAGAVSWPLHEASKLHLNIEEPISVGPAWEGEDCEFWKDIPISPT